MSYRDKKYLFFASLSLEFPEILIYSILKTATAFYHVGTPGLLFLNVIQ